MTEENMKNPSVVLLPDPTDLDLSIQNIQIDLSNKLPWLEKSFGRARMHPSTVNGTRRKELKVYQGVYEYYPVMPNDALKSYSFFRVDGFREQENYSANSYSMYETTRVDHITWVNLRAIDPSNDTIYTETLINEVRKVINFWPDAEILRIWDEKPEDIFLGCTIEESHRDLLMYPFAAWRLEMNLRYELKC